MEKKMVTIIKLLGTIVICGSAYYLYANRRQLKKKLKSLCSKKHDIIALSHADVQVFNAFLPYANDFDGLYEHLFKGAKGLRNKERMLNTINEWSLRIKKVCRTSPELNGWWDVVVANLETLDEKAIQARMGMITDMLQNGGIVRDKRSELIADEETSLYYMEVDDEVWSVGDKLKVDSPCWYLPTTPPRIIEKGYCIKKK